MMRDDENPTVNLIKFFLYFILLIVFSDIVEEYLQTKNYILCLKHKTEQVCERFEP